MQEVYKTIKVRPLTLKDLQERYCPNCPNWYGKEHDYKRKSCERCMRAIKKK